MKAIFICITAMSLWGYDLKSQSFSSWITDAAHPGLQVRYRQDKDRNGYNIILLQVQSKEACSMQITSGICSKDTKEKNGWKNVALTKNKTHQFSFKIRNSCTNGFWWWYKDYKKTTVRYD